MFDNTFFDTQRQTNEWHLIGASYRKDNVLYSVGDTVDNKIILTFDVNGNEKTLEIPRSLKMIETQADEIINGVITYRTNVFKVNQYTVLDTDPSWLQTDTTFICYCQMPFDALNNTLILCDKQSIVGDLITKSNTCGVKVINNILAMRFFRQDLGIAPSDTEATCLQKVIAYLQLHAFEVFYTLSRSNTVLLENANFNINGADNSIVCTTTYPPSYFRVDYPLDVIINTTIDVNEIIDLTQEVRDTKTLIDLIKEELDEALDLSQLQYDEVIDIKDDFNKQVALIETIHTSVTASEAATNTALAQVNELATEVETMTEEMRDIVINIDDTIKAHDTAIDSHQDLRLLVTNVDNSIRDLISDTQTGIETEIQTLTIAIADTNDLVTANDLAAKAQIKEVADNLAALDMALSDDITLLNTATLTNQGDIAAIQDLLDSTQESVGLIEKVSLLESDLSTLKTDTDTSIETTNQAIEALSGEVSAIKSDLTTLNEEVSLLRSDLTTLSGEVSALRSDLTALTLALETHLGIDLTTKE